MADVEILAENAAQVAARKEYSARTAGAHEDAFFAEMGACGTYDRHIGDSAEAELALAAFGAALPRTKGAGVCKNP